MARQDDCGDAIITAIIDGKLVRTDEKCPELLIWSANAAEQLGKLVYDIVLSECTKVRDQAATEAKKAGAYGAATRISRLVIR